jgi:hypothetical protein
LKDLSGNRIDWRKTRLNTGRLHCEALVIIQVRGVWVEVEKGGQIHKMFNKVKLTVECAE